MSSEPGGPVDAQAQSPGPGLLNAEPPIAELLRRRNQGEKLSHRENGRVGNYYRRMGLRSGARPRPPAPAPSLVEPGPSQDPNPLVSDQGPGPGSSAAVVDPQIVRDTTEAILTSLSEVGSSYIEGQALEAGMQPDNSARIGKLVALKDGPKAVLVATSPQVLESLGVDPGNYPLTAAGSMLALWMGQFALAVREIRAYRNELRKQTDGHIRDGGERNGQVHLRDPIPGQS